MTKCIRSPAWGRVAAFLCLLGTLGLFGPAHAQVAEDTTTVDTLQGQAEAPPSAPLDSVESADVAGPDTTDPERALVRADSLSAVERDGERVQELFDNVRVRQDTTRLRSAFGLRYLNRDELLFTGDVVMYERGDTLRADTVRYNKRTKVGRARSNVRLTDGEVTVRAPRAIYYTAEKRSVFPDSVILVDSTRVLRAQEGTYWSDAERAAFSGEVELTDPETYLESDSLTYFRNRERSIAVGEVFIRRVESEGGDTTSTTYLFGEWADNQEQNRYSRVERRALLVRVRRDSAGNPDDTLAVRARQLEATRTDTHRRLVAVDSVRVWQPDLAAVADSLVYDRIIEAGAPDTAVTPTPLPDTTTSPSADTTKPARGRLDSLVAQVELIPLRADGVEGEGAGRPVVPPSVRDTAARREPATASEPDRRARAQRSESSTLPESERTSSRGPPSRDSSARWARPRVQPEAQLPLEETRLFGAPITWFERAQVWGDSIRVRARERRLDTVYVRGAAFAAQRDTTVDRIRQLKGENITAVFRRNSLRKILARPNGQSIYFSASDDGTLNGATQASADAVTLRFAAEDLKRITFDGGVEGQAYHKKKYIPDPFRLKGFQWTPDRRPTRRRLLRERRVRERLALNPDVGSQTPDAPPPDTTVSDSTVARTPAAEERETATGRVSGTRLSGEEGTPRRRPDSLSPSPDTLEVKKSPIRTSPDTTQSTSPEP